MSRIDRQLAAAEREALELPEDREYREDIQRRNRERDEERADEMADRDSDEAAERYFNP